jgi:hypothetical protein
MTNAFRKEYLKRWIAYFTLCCVVFASQQPAKLIAEDCPCILVEPEDACRTRTATIVAGATIIALVGGIAYIAFGSPCHKGHSHSSNSCSSSSYSYDPPFPSYSSYSSYSYSSDSYGRRHHHHHRHHRHSHRSSDYSSDSSFWTGSGYSAYHSASDPQIFERNAEGNLPARSRQLACSKKSKETDQISGVFITHPSLSSSAKGSVTAFVQMPDGTIQVLGSLPFSASGGSSLAYGPFTQKGNYLFGIRIDEGATLSSQTKVGSVEVNINGSTVESRDFFVPAHSPSHYEPTPCEYCL